MFFGMPVFSHNIVRVFLLQISTSANISQPSTDGDVGAENNSFMMSERLNNTTIAILCGVAAFVFAVALVVLVVVLRLLRRQKSR